MFYDNYAGLCKEKGVSPSKAAEEIGINKASVTNWKKNGYTPRADILQRIAGYFGVSVSVLLDGNSLSGKDEESAIDHMPQGEQKEKPTPVSQGGLSDKDIRLIAWFRSLPPEKRRAILMLGEAPEGLDE